METVAWVGALETAIGILYLALIGQRSIAQWLDDRRRQKPTSKTADEEVEQESKVEASNPPPRSRPRLLSVQSIGDYIEYVWRDPAEAALNAAKALTLGCVLLFGTATLLLLLGALALEVVVFFSGSRELDQMAQRIAEAGGNAGAIAIVGGLVAPFAVLGVNSLADGRKREQEWREQEERRRAQQQAQTERRRRSAGITAAEMRQRATGRQSD